MMVTPNTMLLLMAAAVKAAELDGGHVRLFQNDVTPDQDTVIGDLTVADFGGYAQVAVAMWGDAYIDADGRVSSLGGLISFGATGVAPSNLIYGAYYVDASGDLVWAFRFDTPQSMSLATDEINIVPRFQYGQLPPL